MNKLKYFFRYVPDTINSGPTSLSLFLSGLVFFLLIAYIRYFSKLDLDYKRKHLVFLKKTIFFLLLIDVGSRYSWYILSGYSDLRESLPLYHCRLVVILSLLYLVKKDEKLSPLIFFWGVFGGVLALFYPVMDNFVFPHFLNILFYTSHISILLMSFVTFVENRDYILNRKKEIRLFTLGFNITLSLINIKLSSNYGYLAHAPLDLGILTNQKLIYLILLFSFYDLLIRIIYRSSIFYLKLDQKEKKPRKAIS